MEQDSIMSSSVPNTQAQEGISSRVKQELMFTTLEKDMTHVEQEKKLKDDYLKGKA